MSSPRSAPSATATTAIPIPSSSSSSPSSPLPPSSPPALGPSSPSSAPSRSSFSETAGRLWTRYLQASPTNSILHGTSPFALLVRAGQGHGQGQPVGDDDEDDVEGEETTQAKVDFISSLPPELALEILSALSLSPDSDSSSEHGHTELLNCTRVSRRWRQLAMDGGLWRDLFHTRRGWRLRLPSHWDGTGTEAETDSEGDQEGRLDFLTTDLSSLSLSSAASLPPPSPSSTTQPQAAPTPLTPRHPIAPVLSRANSNSNSTSTSSATSALAALSSNLSLSRSRSQSQSRTPTSPASSSLTRRLTSSKPSPSPSPRPTPLLPPVAHLNQRREGKGEGQEKEIHYPTLYRDRHLLSLRWARGEAKSTYLTGHEDSVYCLCLVKLPRGLGLAEEGEAEDQGRDVGEEEEEWGVVSGSVSRVGSICCAQCRGTTGVRLASEVVADSPYSRVRLLVPFYSSLTPSLFPFLPTVPPSSDPHLYNLTPSSSISPYPSHPLCPPPCIFRL